MARVPVWGTGGRGFESRLFYLKDFNLMVGVFLLKRWGLGRGLRDTVRQMVMKTTYIISDIRMGSPFIEAINCLLSCFFEPINLIAI